MTRYVALVDGKGGSYGVTVPDLPGCTSAAATTDEVLRRATDAVRLWAEDALADGEKLPKPRSVEALRADPEVAVALAEGAALAIVPLVLDAGRPAKANLSLDAGLLAAIDEAAAARGLPRSAFLASAAREKIESESRLVTPELNLVWLTRGPRRCARARAQCGRRDLFRQRRPLSLGSAKECLSRHFGPGPRI
jgi:predicted RNase H-like HicB family nuclease